MCLCCQLIVSRLYESHHVNVDTNRISLCNTRTAYIRAFPHLIWTNLLHAVWAGLDQWFSKSRFILATILLKVDYVSKLDHTWPVACITELFLIKQSVIQETQQSKINFSLKVTFNMVKRDEQLVNVNTGILHEADTIARVNKLFSLRTDWICISRLNLVLVYIKLVMLDKSREYILAS